MMHRELALRRSKLEHGMGRARVLDEQVVLRITVALHQHAFFEQQAHALELPVSLVNRVPLVAQPRHDGLLAVARLRRPNPDIEIAPHPKRP